VYLKELSLCCTDLNGCESGTTDTETVDCGAPIPVTDSFTAMKMTPIVDGIRESVWNEAEIVEFNHDNSVAAIGDYTDSIDLKARVSAFWDVANLYFLFEVNDDNIVDDSAQLWHDDSVEIYIEGEKNSIGEYLAVDGKITIGVENQAMGYKSNGWDSAATIVRKITPSGYQIEFSIPFSVIGITPVIGHRLGVTLQVNDDDLGGDYDTALIWHLADPNGAYPNSDTNQFGTLELIEYTAPECAVKMITSLCNCGGTEHSTGYCCEGSWQSTECITYHFDVNMDGIFSILDVLAVISHWRSI